MVENQLQKESQIAKPSHSFGWAFWSILFFLCISLGGEVFSSFSGNGQCSPYFGCVTGFVGFDAVEHFFFGVCAILTLLFIFEKFPKYSLQYDSPWKTALVLVSIVMLLAVLWEIGECAHDYFRVDILHENLFSLRLHINALDQPTNLDTMGDLVFSLLGVLISLVIFRKRLIS